MKNKDENDKAKVQDKAEIAVKAFISEFSFNNDPLGSYTGKPEGYNDKPEQDADDL